MYTMPGKPPSPDRDLSAGPTVQFRKCPIHATIGVLGKKWTFLILRDVAFLNITRFNQIKRSLPGLTSRVLVLRLHELETCGIIEAKILTESPRVVEWSLTEKGRDTIPILKSIMNFGITWFADEVFEDHKPRNMIELYPDTVPAD
jgi:DNA-binding HxlR family transcriptional regulator